MSGRPWRQDLLTASALTGLVVALFAVRWSMAPNRWHLYLLWNLFLAWSPYVVALVASWSRERRRTPVWAMTGILVGWLLLFPNAPYLVTDLIHLKRTAGVPFWFDPLVFAAFAGMGWLLGMLSIEQWWHWVAHLYGELRAWLFVVATAVLSGYGIWLGRIERWNSWDALTRPHALARSAAGHLTDPLEHAGLLPMTSVFALTVAASAWAFIRLRRP